MIDKDTTLSTSSLFHYTCKDSLIKIIESGYFKTSFSLEKFNFAPICNQVFNSFFDPERKTSPTLPRLNDEVYIGMVCFCDIPLKLVNNHINVYDKYAIGLTKDWGNSVGVSPVTYLPNSGGTKSLIENLINSYYNDFPCIQALQEKEFSKELIDKDGILLTQIMGFYSKILDLVFYTKPYQGDYKKGESIIKDYKFYDEREWRFIPNNMLYKPYVSISESETTGFEFPALPPLSFDVKDITNIIVPKDELDFMKKTVSNMPYMKDFDLDKIKSLEEIKS